MSNIQLVTSGSFPSLPLSLLLPIICLTFNLPVASTKCPRCEVQGLAAEADYRSIKLNWKYLQSQEPPAFRVKYCEITSQSTSMAQVRCRQRVYPLSRAVTPKNKWHMKNPNPEHNPNLLGKLLRIDKGAYQIHLTELKMMTNYSLDVEADFYGFPYTLNGGSIPYHLQYQESLPVMVETKGFSGQTIRCLGNHSEVAVNTGPYFGGRISVEGASDSSCFLNGNRSSPMDIYTIHLNHLLCGSKVVNNSSIETMIIVHENRDILTHNSRRFLVVCNFPPDTYTFTASVEVPPHLLKRKKNQSPSPITSTASPHLEREDSTISVPKRPSFHSARPIHPTGRDDPTSEDPSNHINLHDKYKVNNMADSRILLPPTEHSHSPAQLRTRDQEEGEAVSRQLSEGSRRGRRLSERSHPSSTRGSSSATLFHQMVLVGVVALIAFMASIIFFLHGEMKRSMSSRTISVHHPPVHPHRSQRSLMPTSSSISMSSPTPFTLPSSTCSSGPSSIVSSPIPSSRLYTSGSFMYL